MTIDINCDMGELMPGVQGYADESVMPFISSANIACGFHAGDPLTMERTVRLAIKYGVAVGAHPGYPDREGFGRKDMEMSADEITAMILYQAGALRAIAEAAGGRLAHVKPHGALYNRAAADPAAARAVAQAVKLLGGGVSLTGLSGSQMAAAASEAGITFVSEVFADRGYNDDGSLVKRGTPGDLITDTKTMTDRVIMMIKERAVYTVIGNKITIEAGTICIHGDNSSAADFVRTLNNALKREGITISPPAAR